MSCDGISATDDTAFSLSAAAVLTQNAFPADFGSSVHLARRTQIAPFAHNHLNVVQIVKRRRNSEVHLQRIIYLTLALNSAISSLREARQTTLGEMICGGKTRPRTLEESINDDRSCFRFRRNWAFSPLQKKLQSKLEYRRQKASAINDAERRE